MAVTKPRAGSDLAGIEPWRGTCLYRFDRNRRRRMSSRQEEPGTLSQVPGARSFTTLSRDLADFLVEFSIVLHKRALYPHGHPHLQETGDHHRNSRGRGTESSA